VKGLESAYRHARPVTCSSPTRLTESTGNRAGFESRDHRLLASALKEASRSHIGVIAFNAPEAAPIYHWANCEQVTRSGCVSSKASDRDPVSELVITAGLRR